MTRKIIAIAGATAAVAAVAVGSGVAYAQGGGPGSTDATITRAAGTSPAAEPADPEEPEAPITGDPLTMASAAALAHTGGGRVTETEVGDEEGFYEVEVTLADGSQVDVHLDERFVVLSGVADEETGR